MDPLKHVVEFAPTKKALSLYGEFKEFALKGTVIDMAVGIIIGTAFSDIIKSLVGDVIMPLIGILLSGNNGYEGWKLDWHGATVPFGKFIGQVVHFLIIAVVVFFFVVKFLGFVMRAKKEEAAAPLSRDQELLTEIRDLLKKGQTEGRAG
jgi:large conductance mechanosensitive channel